MFFWSPRTSARPDSGRPGPSRSGRPDDQIRQDPANLDQPRSLPPKVARSRVLISTKPVQPRSRSSKVAPGPPKYALNLDKVPQPDVLISTKPAHPRFRSPKSPNFVSQDAPSRASSASIFPKSAQVSASSPKKV